MQYNINKLSYPILALSLCLASPLSIADTSQLSAVGVSQPLVDNSPEAQFSLASALSYGKAVAKNPQQAFQWYTKAAEQGHAKAQYNLAVAYGLGIGTTKDEEKALFWYQKAAEQGVKEAQYNLAIFHARGLYVPRSTEKGRYWYQKSAEQGYAEAQYNLAHLYSQEKDEKQAFYWYQKAAQQGMSYAQYNLSLYYERGTGVEKNEEKARYWYSKARKSEQQTDLNAMITLATVYHPDDPAIQELGNSFHSYPEQTRPLSENDITQMTQLANQGDAIYQYGLAQLYTNGYGNQTPDANQAFYWYQKAAQQNYADSSIIVALAYDLGIGVTADKSQALKLYQQVIDKKSDSFVALRLGQLYENGEGVQQDLSQAAQWYQQAAEADEPLAQYHLAKLYEDGLGVTKDLDKARYWYTKAAEQGSEDAKKALAALGK